MSIGRQFILPKLKTMFAHVLFTPEQILYSIPVTDPTLDFYVLAPTSVYSSNVYKHESPAHLFHLYDQLAGIFHIFEEFARIPFVM